LPRPPRPKPLPTRDELRETAIRSLVDVSADKTAPPAARAAAARTILESIGDIGRLQETQRSAEKPLTELTAAELDQEIARLKPKA
jgi:hypothetical protein